MRCPRPAGPFRIGLKSHSVILEIVDWIEIPHDVINHVGVVGSWPVTSIDAVRVQASVLTKNTPSVDIPDQNQYYIHN